MTWLDPDPFFSSADPGFKIKWILSTATKLCRTVLINTNMETKRSCQLYSFSLLTCKLVIWKKLVRNLKSRLYCIDMNADYCTEHIIIRIKGSDRLC